jgi:hypothetical protein
VVQPLQAQAQVETKARQSVLLVLLPEQAVAQEPVRAQEL